MNQYTFQFRTPVSFEIAKLLKDKGFDGIEIDYGLNQILNLKPAPTIAEVVMWLYEKHGIWVSVLQMLHNGEKVIWYASYYEQGVGEDIEEYYDSPTEAYEAAINYVLLNLI
jgi:hypothetical protein